MPARREGEKTAKSDYSNQMNQGPGTCQAKESSAGANQLSDQELVAEVLRKDRKATAEFVDRYADHAVGQMGRNAGGKMAITVVTLQPEVRFSGDKLPSTEEIEAMHHAAHDECFIANSVKTEVRCEPVRPGGAPQ